MAELFKNLMIQGKTLRKCIPIATLWELLVYISILDAHLSHHRTGLRMEVAGGRESLALTEVS